MKWGILVGTNTGVKYIGKDAVYEDNILRTGLTWNKGETHILPVVMAKEFLKHPGVFAEVPGASYLIESLAQDVVLESGGVVVELGRKAPAYLTFLPCDQSLGGGGPIDRSDAGNDAFLRLDYADDGAGPWSTSGYLKTVAGTDKYAQLAGAAMQVDHDKHSVLIAFQANLANNTTDPVTLLAWGTSGGNTKGIYLSKSGSKTLRVGINKGAGGSSLFFSSKAIADAADHTIILLITNKHDVHLFIDSDIPDTTKLNAFTGSVVTDPAVQFAIGGVPDAALSGGGSVDTLIKNLHALRWEGAPPINTPQIIRRLLRTPGDVLRKTEVMCQATETRLLVVVGQSNEQGAGETKDQVVSYGPPLRDPILPSTSALRSMWPGFVEAMARDRRIWTKVFNAAIGGTAATDNWCGCIRTWQANIFATNGLYVLSGGGIWKSAQPTSGASAYVVSTVAPIGTADTTGADGIAWTYLGVPTAADVPGVLAEGHARFDPRGMLAAAMAGLSNLADQKWVLIQFGQNDSLCVKSQGEFAAAYRNMANYFIAHGADKVSLGISCYNSPGIDVVYQSTLIPAVEGLLAEFAGNPKVVRGANLRTALGVLPTATSRGLPGLKSTDASPVHMNDAAYKIASDAEFDAYTLVGW